MEQSDYWNKVAGEKKFTTPFQPELLAKFVGKNGCVLDIGCGYGRTLNDLYLNGYTNLYGIDSSEMMINRGKSEYPYLKLEFGDGKNTGYKDNSFDAVILFGVLTCVVNNQEQLSLIEEGKRLLRPGGILYINDFLINYDDRNVLRYERDQDKYQNYGVFESNDGVVLRHHAIDWIKNLTASLERVVFETVTFPTMNGNQSNGFYFIGRKRYNVLGY